MNWRIAFGLYAALTLLFLAVALMNGAILLAGGEPGLGLIGLMLFLAVAAVFSRPSRIS